MRNGRCHSSSRSSVPCAAGSRWPSPTARRRRRSAPRSSAASPQVSPTRQIRAYFAQTLGDDILLRPSVEWLGRARVGAPDRGPRRRDRRHRLRLLATGERWCASGHAGERHPLRPCRPRLRTRSPTLEEQQRFLQRSLSDLEREHDAGDLDDDDYATLKHDYEARLAVGRRAPSRTARRSSRPSARSSNPRAHRGHRRRRRRLRVAVRLLRRPKRRSSRCRQHDHR